MNIASLLPINFHSTVMPSMPGADILQFPHPNAHAHTAAVFADTPDSRSPGLAELQLVNRLHRHLDIHTLLEEFLIEIRSSLPVEGLCYTAPDSGEAFLVGNGGRYSVRSRIQHAGEHLGDIEMQTALDTRAPLASALALLSAPLSNALCHHRLKLLARKDSLTGLGNRMALDASLATELARAQRFGHPFALLVVDIDHFKRINDRFGHSTGDQVLRAVAAQIIDCLRPYDQAFRFGGEEFVVMLSQTAQTKGMEIAERIRQRISTQCRTSAGLAHKITVSIGCGEFRHDETIGNLFDRADRALYAAKNQGRNRVVAAS